MTTTNNQLAIDQLAIDPLPLASDNFLKNNPEVFRSAPFWIMGFDLAEVRDVTNVIAFPILFEGLNPISEREPKKNVEA